MLNPAEFIMNFKYAFRPAKPLLTIRLAKAVINTNFFGNTQLRFVDFAIDFACNLKCEHCFATALEQKGRNKMSTEDYNSVAEQAMKLGCVNFSFQGGEPLMFKNLKNIIRACYPDRNLISVTTNGTLIDEDKIKWLKSFGVDILTVSIDSSSPEKHDRFRGMKGAYEKTLKGIKLALKNKINVTIGTVVTHQSLASGDIEGLVALAKELRVLIYLILPVPAGNWTHCKDMMLTDEDQKTVYAMTKKTHFVRTDFQANFSRFGCGAAKEILYLTPYGDVLTCPFIHISPGNIFEDSIKIIRERALDNPYFNHYHDKCLASTDAAFIDKHLSRTFGQKNLPLKWENVFPSDKKG